MVFEDIDGLTYKKSAFLFQPHRTDPQHSQGEYQATGPKSLRIRYSPQKPGRLKWKLFSPGSEETNPKRFPLTMSWFLMLAKKPPAP